MTQEEMSNLITRACGHKEPADSDDLRDYGQAGESRLCRDCAAAAASRWMSPDAILQAIMDDGR